jgi:hypothetical protein
VASVDTITFDEAAYAPGATITMTVGYTPDSPSVVPQTFTATVNVSDPSGNVLATNTAPFVVNESQPAGDVVSATDTGSRTWALASDTGSVAVLTATA